MSRFERDRLPEPAIFYETEGLALKGPGKWKTTSCAFHGGSDSMRINSETGAFKCMACGKHGGDVLSYYMQRTGLEFRDAADAIGAMVEDGSKPKEARKTTLPAASALALIQSETWLIACTALATAGAIKEGPDRLRLIEAARTIQHIMREVSE